MTLMLFVRFAILILISLAIVFWTRTIARSIEPGLLRGCSYIPVFFLNLLLSTLFVKESGYVKLLFYYIAVVYLWLVNWKVFGLAVNRGPLAKHLNDNIKTYALLLLFPINVESTKNYSTRERKTITLHGLIIAQILLKVVCLFTLVQFCWYMWNYELIRDFCLSWFVYSYISLVMDVLSIITLAFTDMKLMPHFNKPWLTISISEFWAVRWNLVAGSLLRDLIYDPIIEGQLIYFDQTENKKSRSITAKQRITGTIVAFIFSGIMHWLLIWFTINTYAWKNFLFFIIHALLLISEKLMIKITRKNKKVLNLVSNIPFFAKAIFYNLLIIYLAHKFYWPEIIESGAALPLIEFIKIF